MATVHHPGITWWELEKNHLSSPRPLIAQSRFAGLHTVTFQGTAATRWLRQARPCLLLQP